MKPIKRNYFIAILSSLQFANCLIASESPLYFFPKFSTEYFSSGSILHPNESGASMLNTISLGAKKRAGAWTIQGNFEFITGRNANLSSTYFNRDISIENQRGYYNVDDTWFESSTLLMTYTGGEKFNFYFGKEHMQWGQGQSSLILSKNIPTYPIAGFNWVLSKNLKLDYLVGSLSSMIEDTTNTNYQDVETRKVYKARGIAAHRLIWTITKQFTFSAMESVVFGNRSIDEHYLLPFIPFWSMQHYIGDTDNIQMCGELSWTPNEKLNAYASLFVDEWRPEWTFKKHNRNWFGYQAGITLNNFWMKKDFLRLEFTWTDHRVYRHKYPINESYSFNYSLGFWAGPHAEELLLGYYFTFKGIDISSTISSATRGQLTEEMVSNQYKDIIDNRFSGNSESRTHAQITAHKSILNDKLTVKFGVDWIDWENAGFNPFNPENIGKDVEKFSFNIGLTATTDIMFD